MLQNVMILHTITGNYYSNILIYSIHTIYSLKKFDMIFVESNHPSILNNKIINSPVSALSLLITSEDISICSGSSISIAS